LRENLAPARDEAHFVAAERRLKAGHHVDAARGCLWSTLGRLPN
jgi:hypothetical protein